MSDAMWVVMLGLGDDDDPEAVCACPSESLALKIAEPLRGAVARVPVLTEMPTPDAFHYAYREVWLSGHRDRVESYPRWDFMSPEPEQPVRVIPPVGRGYYLICGGSMDLPALRRAIEEAHAELVAGDLTADGMQR